MANTSGITNQELTPGVNICVKGEMLSSHVSEILTGAKLEEYNANLPGRSPKETRPLTTLRLSNAQLLPMNPAGMNKEEQYVQGSFYQTQEAPEMGWQYQGRNRGNFKPNVYQLQEDGSYRQVILDREIAIGTPVRVLINVFESQTYDNKGLSVNTIFVDQAGPFPYAPEPGQVDPNILAALGITYSNQPPIGNTPATAPNQPTQPQAQAPAQAQTPMPQPQQPMAQTPVANQVANMPAPGAPNNYSSMPAAPVQTQPQAPQPPQAQAQPVQAQPQNNDGFGAPAYYQQAPATQQQTQTPQAPAAPVAQPPAQPQAAATATGTPFADSATAVPAGPGTTPWSNPEETYTPSGY